MLELAVRYFFFVFLWNLVLLGIAPSAQSFSKPTSLAVVCNGDACGPTWTHPSVEHIRFDYIEHQHPAWVLGYLCRLVKKGHRFCDRHCLESRRLLYFKPRVPHHAWWEDARDTFNVYGYWTCTSHGGIRLRNGPIAFPLSLWGFPYAFVQEEVMAVDSDDNEETLGQPFTVELD